GIAMAYLVPDFANPTGLTLSVGARRRHIALARSLGVPLIEDAAYTELRYGGEPVAKMMALDIADCGSIERSCVIYCGTFSKVICPGLRVGWVVAAEPIIQKLVLIKQAADLNASLINQMVMYRLASTCFEDCRSKAIEMYRSRRDAMLGALKSHFAGRATWSNPDGGLFVWMTLANDVDSAALLKVALADQNVAFVPGAGFYSDDAGCNKLRLSFSQNSPERIAEGVRRLAMALDTFMAAR
ncbi:MAG: PLP-dependent aminotransferase family protein, partial [Hyphomicrobiaceae bacterium]|nr:PLP-dependent aminotransferase family protein [Hyphomicrobiaceae bacterium]